MSRIISNRSTKPLDGPSETNLPELIMETGVSLENTDQSGTKNLQLPLRNHELRCHGLNLLTGYDKPRLYILCQLGSLYVELGEAQLLGLTTDGMRHLAK